MGTGEFNAGCSLANMDWHPIQGVVEYSFSLSATESGDKRRPDEPLARMETLTFYVTINEQFALQLFLNIEVTLKKRHSVDLGTWQDE